MQLYTENKRISKILRRVFLLITPINYKTVILSGLRIIITNLIAEKCNLQVEWDQIYIQMLINLHRTEPKPQSVAIICLNYPVLVKITESKRCLCLRMEPFLNSG